MTTTARTRQSAALLAVFVLALLAGRANPTAAHGIDGYGSHTHGKSTCYVSTSATFYRYISLNGITVSSNRAYLGASDPGNLVYVEAYLYKWNGSSWAYQTGSGWKSQTVRGSATVTFGARFPATYSTNGVVNSLSPGYYRVAAWIFWYDAPSADYMGQTPNTWTSHYNYNATGATGPVSYCTFGGSATASTAARSANASTTVSDGADDGTAGRADAALPRAPHGEGGKPVLPEGERAGPKLARVERDAACQQGDGHKRGQRDGAKADGANADRAKCRTGAGR